MHRDGRYGSCRSLSPPFCERDDYRWLGGENEKRGGSTVAQAAKLQHQDTRDGRRKRLATFITFPFPPFHLLCAFAVSRVEDPVKNSSLIPVEGIQSAIYLIRGQKVMLVRK